MITMRRMLADDLAAVEALEQQLFSAPWSRMAFLQELADHEAFVAVDEEEIVGYICAWQVLDECSITNVGVSPRHQRRGIGRMLVNFILEHMQQAGCTICFLEVRAGNTPARELYTAIGFEVIGLRKKYYHTPVEDALVMAYRKD
jgi:ribosomal-protein-alanine N-acetyltransferase